MLSIVTPLSDIAYTSLFAHFQTSATPNIHGVEVSESQKNGVTAPKYSIWQHLWEISLQLILRSCKTLISFSPLPRNLGGLCNTLLMEMGPVYLPLIRYTHHKGSITVG